MKELSEKYSGFAIASFSIGLFCLFFGWIPIFGWILIILTLTFGFIGLKQTKNDGIQGKIFAYIGIILGSIWAVLIILILMILFSPVKQSMETAYSNFVGTIAEKTGHLTGYLVASVVYPLLQHPILSIIIILGLFILIFINKKYKLIDKFKK